MITIDGVQYRNLEEQVKKNKDDIQYILEEEGVLNEFGIHVVDEVASSSDLPDPTTYEGEFGDAYAVGTTTPYELYIYTRANGEHPTNYWFNIGEFPLPGPAGPQGIQGIQGPTGQRGSLWTSGAGNPTSTSNVLTNDKYLNTNTGDVFNFNGTIWILVGNIKGPQGIQGIQGNVGPQGPQGLQGQQGPKGEQGDAFVIAGTVANEGQLPDPSTLPDNVAYLVGSGEDYDLYVQLQDSETWQNVGKVATAEGPQGPVGPQGPQGPQGVQGVQGPQGESVQNVVIKPEGEIIVPDGRLKNFLFSFRLKDSDGKFMFLAGSKLINTSFNSFREMMEGKDIYFGSNPTPEQLENIGQFVSWVFDTSYSTGTIYEPGIPCHGIYTDDNNPQDSIEICTAGSNADGSGFTLCAGGYNTSGTFTAKRIHTSKLKYFDDYGCKFVSISGDFNYE